MWNELYDITPDELSQIMELCRHSEWICARFEPEETLYILFLKVDENDNVVDKKSFDFLKYKY